MIEAIILDYDGVLVESNAAKDEAFRELFGRFPEVEEKMAAFHTRHHSEPRHLKFQHYVSELLGGPGDAEALEEMHRLFSQIVVEKVIGCHDVPGARELLRTCRGRISLYVSSNTPEEELRKTMEARGLLGYFNHVFGDPPNSKAHAIRRILDWEQCAAEAVVFVGDAQSDYRVATEHGLRFIGRDSGQTFEAAGIEIHSDLHAVLRAIQDDIGG